MFRQPGSGASNRSRASISATANPSRASSQTPHKEARKPFGGDLLLPKLGSANPYTTSPQAGSWAFPKGREESPSLPTGMRQGHPFALRWYAPPALPSAEVSQVTPVVPEEEPSILKGSGVSIAPLSTGFWSTPSRSYQVEPLPDESNTFRTKLLEVRGLPRKSPQALAEPVSAPTATPLPGKPGFVELSFDSRGLPPVDVRGLPPGAEVQIVDPVDPGKTIRFRIPEVKE